LQALLDGENSDRSSFSERAEGNFFIPLTTYLRLPTPVSAWHHWANLYIRVMHPGARHNLAPFSNDQPEKRKSETGSRKTEVSRNCLVLS